MKEISDKFKKIFTMDVVVPLILTAYGVAVVSGIVYVVEHIKSSFEKQNNIEYRTEIRAEF